MPHFHTQNQFIRIVVHKSILPNQSSKWRTLNKIFVISLVERSSQVTRNRLKLTRKVGNKWRVVWIDNHLWFGNDYKISNWRQCLSGRIWKQVQFKIRTESTKFWNLILSALAQIFFTREVMASAEKKLKRVAHDAFFQLIRGRS